MDVLIQAVIVFGAVILGSRYKGIGLGLWGGAAVLLLSMFCGLKPTSAPVDVLLIILTVTVACAVMYAAGGVDFMISIAEKIIRANPSRIVFVAPMVTWFFAFISGTAYIINSLLPIIYEVSMGVGIRPERPMTVATIAGQQALVASPVAACGAALLGLLATTGAHNITVGHIMMVTVPATLLGILCSALVMVRYGKDLADDEEYQERLKNGLVPPVKPASARVDLPRNAKIAMWIFIAGVALAVVGGFFPVLRTPAGATKPVGMAVFLEMCMFASSLVMLLVCKPKLNEAVNSPIMRAGISAVICVFGLAWMGDTFIKAHSKEWVDTLGVYMKAYPWLLAFGLFFASSILSSQAATVRAIMPLGVALGLTPATLIGLYPSVNGTSFFPTSGVVVACISFDQAGTTKIGKFVLNHSFMPSVLIQTGIATIVAMFLSSVLL